MPRSPELLIEPPAVVLEAARRWLERMRPALGTDFLAAYVTGSALTQGFNPRRSDVNLLLVTRTLPPDMLDRLADALPAQKKHPRISPLFFTRHQIEKSLDAFPMEFLDMKESHLLLEGENVLADLEVPRTYLRLQCEHELRGKFIQLRQTYLLQHGYPELLAETLARAASSFAALFRNLLRLRGEMPPAHTPRVIERVADLYGLRGEGLLLAYTIRYGDKRPRAADLRRHYQQFLGEVERLVSSLDELSVR